MLEGFEHVTDDVIVRLVYKEVGKYFNLGACEGKGTIKVCHIITTTVNHFINTEKFQLKSCSC